MAPRIIHIPELRKQVGLSPLSRHNSLTCHSCVCVHEHFCAHSSRANHFCAISCPCTLRWHTRWMCCCSWWSQVLNAFLQIIANQATRAVEPGLLLELINILDRWVTDPYPGQEVRQYIVVCTTYPRSLGIALYYAYCIPCPQEGSFDMWLYGDSLCASTGYLGGS